MDILGKRPNLLFLIAVRFLPKYSIFKFNLYPGDYQSSGYTSDTEEKIKEQLKYLETYDERMKLRKIAENKFPAQTYYNMTMITPLHRDVYCKKVIRIRDRFKK
jgi:hypothetical protein